MSWVDLRHEFRKTGCGGKNESEVEACPKPTCVRLVASPRRMHVEIDRLHSYTHESVGSYSFSVRVSISLLCYHTPNEHVG